MMNCESLYGNYRTRTFSQIYPDAASFVAAYDMGIPAEYTITDDAATLLYTLLLARYANSHIASSDETQFKLKVAALIMQYGPTWLTKLEMQKEIRDLDIEDLQMGALQIANHAYNPSTDPSTDSSDILEKIDQQNTVRYKRSLVDAYNDLIMLLEKDVTEEFLNRFRKLFLVVVEPELPLWYESEVLFDV